MSEFVDMRLTELLCSRLCHELASPVGAINNGIEMIEEFDDSMLSDALPLIGSSAKFVAARLSFYRMAYGAAGTHSLGSFADVKELVEAYFADSRTKISWPTDATIPELREGWGKLLLNLLSLAADTLPRGGVISVAFHDEADGHRLIVAAEGEGARISKECGEAMVPDVPLASLTPRSVHAYFVCRLSDRFGAGLCADDDASGRIVFTVRLAP